jgi:nucleoside phosphorylase
MEHLANMLEARKKIAFPLNVHLGYDITIVDFFTSFYKAPNLRAATGSGQPLPELVATERLGSTGTRAIITGPMGAGKSTYLLYQYLRCIELRHAGSSHFQPPFLNFEQLLTHHGDDRLKELSQQPCVVFVDSLDETSAGEDRLQVLNQVQRLAFLPGLVLACRAPFFFDVLSEIRPHFDIVVELQQLQQDDQSALITQYLQAPQLMGSNASSQVIARACEIARRCRGHVTSENLLMGTPLFSALCALVALDRVSPHRFSGIAEVYGQFLNIVIARKLNGNKTARASMAQLAFELEVAAIHGGVITDEQLTHMFGENFSSRISDILICRPSERSEDIVIKGFRHRSFGEFLLANHIASTVSSSKMRRDKLVNILGMFLNYETSFFVRRLLRQLPARDLSRSSSRLLQVAIAGSCATEEETIIASHNALYFGISSAKNPEKFIQKFLNATSEQSTHVHPLVLGTLIAGAVSAEASLPGGSSTRMLEENTSLRWRTLNYHMIYYGDMEVTGLRALTAPISPGTSWEKTRTILLERLQSRDEKRLQYRAWDLCNLRHFLIATSYELNESEHQNLIRSLAYSKSIPNVDGETEQQVDLMEAYLAGRKKADRQKSFMRKGRLAKRTQRLVDFGIITIREDEFGAVLQRLPGYETFPGVNRNYRQSELEIAHGSCYRIAIVRSPEQGPGPAQNLARDMIEDLNPNWILVVGIGGGVPDDDLTLGDVVLGMRLHDFSVSAAMEGKESEFSNMGGPMHREVESTIANLSNSDDKFGDWHSAANIGLPVPRIQWNDDRFYGSAQWKKRVKRSLRRQFTEVGEKKRSHRFITAGISSSGTLVKDTSLLAQWIQSARDTRAVEMELAGVYEAARRRMASHPVLAIRGISDIIGYKREPEWTEFAAHSAAAFTLAFLKSGPIAPAA